MSHAKDGSLQCDGWCKQTGQVTSGYQIRSAGQYEGTLAAVGQPVGRHTYPTVEAAAHEVGLVARSASTVCTYECDDEHLVYLDGADRDRDQDGSLAVASIVEVQS